MFNPALLTLNRRTLIIATAALLGPTAPALAHARLRQATPAPGATLSTAPKQVSITFSEALEPKFSAIEVRNSSGKRFDNGPPRAGADSKTLIVDLKPLPTGDYTVVWRATSVDTHKTDGSFSFMLHA